MEKIYVVVLLKDSDTSFISYLEEVHTFKEKKDAKAFLDKSYELHFAKLAEHYHVSPEDLIEDETSELLEDEYVVGFNGGNSYYYGNLKETIIK